MDSFYCHPTAVIDAGSQIGSGTKIWHFTHIMPGAIIGEGCNIGQNVVVMPGVVLGSGVKVQNNVSIYTGVACEDEVFLGPSCVFTNVINPRSAIDRKHEYRTTLVKKGATIGANATIVCGIEIGMYAFIGAGAVVTRNIMPYELVYGNPAQHKGWISAAGYTLEFNADGFATCPETLEAYQLRDNKVFKLN